MLNSNKQQKRKEVVEFIKKNPRATYRELKFAGYSHIERLFDGGLAEAYKEADLEPPRTFNFKSKEERRKVIIDYIKKHPFAGGQTIAKDTKININHAFDSIKDAFETAKVTYPREENLLLRKRTKKEKRDAIIALIKNNPTTTIKDISKLLKIKPYKVFNNFKEIYHLAGLEEIGHAEKRTLRKRKMIVEFIKKNPLATQREINKNCKTRIQGLFEHGIFGAYKEAGIEFPFERLKLHGAAKNEVKKRAEEFEVEIARRLSRYGTVSRLIKTKRGKADIILERNGKEVIIEVKDYLNKEISQHEIKQLNRYLEDCNCDIGFIVCHTKPQKDKFLMGKNELLVVNDRELEIIPNIIDSR